MLTDVNVDTLHNDVTTMMIYVHCAQGDYSDDLASQYIIHRQPFAMFIDAVMSINFACACQSYNFVQTSATVIYHLIWMCWTRIQFIRIDAFAYDRTTIMENDCLHLLVLCMSFAQT